MFGRHGLVLVSIKNSKWLKIIVVLSLSKDA